MHRYEWPLGKVVRVFPDPLGVIRTAEVEEGGRSSICSVTFLVPLEFDCYDDEEGDISETEAAGDCNEATSSEASKPPFNEESIISGHDSPISFGIDSSSAGPPKRPQAETAEMQLSRLNETHLYESADPHERDSESPPQCMSVGVTPNTPTEKRVASSHQPATTSRELVPLSNTAQPEELILQLLPRRAATRQRKLPQELIQEDLIYSIFLRIASYTVIVRV